MTTDTTTTPAQEEATPAEAEERARKARIENNNRARRELLKLLRSVTQGDWLAVCRLLDLTRDQISDDENLMMLAGAYVKEKRTHGEASIDILLELTDRGLLEYHGYQLEPLEEEGDGGA